MSINRQMTWRDKGKLVTDKKIEIKKFLEIEKQTSSSAIFLASTPNTYCTNVCLSEVIPLKVEIKWMSVQASQEQKCRLKDTSTCCVIYYAKPN